jgi:predicted GNAT superfamily acetyltransferase
MVAHYYQAQKFAGTPYAEEIRLTPKPMDVHRHPGATPVITLLPDRRPENPGWEFHRIHTPEQVVEVEALQRIVWPGSDLDIVPGHVLLTAAHNGGLAAGAYIGGRLAGFVWGFLGLDTATDPPRLKHCSHQLGVHPDFRSTGLGFALKCFQREFVLGQGLDRITWTYDPLMARNAQLNIAKLGAVCHTYLPNLYGELQDGLNAGLPSDRFQVDWWITTARVAVRASQKPELRPSIADLLDAGALLVNPPSEPDLPEPPDRSAWQEQCPSTVLIEIPSDFLALKAADPARALRWRLSTCAAFEALFGQGYTVTDFVHAPDRVAYVLTQETT